MSLSFPLSSERDFLTELSESVAFFAPESVLETGFLETFMWLPECILISDGCGKR